MQGNFHDMHTQSRSKQQAHIGDAVDGAHVNGLAYVGLIIAPLCVHARPAPVLLLFRRKGTCTPQHPACAG